VKELLSVLQFFLKQHVSEIDEGEREFTSVCVA
jgi:hypothetical protein